MSMLGKTIGLLGIASLGVWVFHLGQPTVSDVTHPIAIQPIHWIQPAKTVPVATNISTVASAPSLNWAGVVQTGNQETRVSAAWITPGWAAGTTANPNSAIAEWVGLGGLNSPSLIQVGTMTAPDNNGNPVTTAFWEVLPAAAHQTVVIPTGTRVTAAIIPLGNDSWRLLLTGQGYNQPIVNQVVHLTPSQAAGIETSADWITEAPTAANGSVLPLAPVASTTMTNVEANGIPLSQMNPNSLEAINLQGSDGQVMAQVASDGGSTNQITVDTAYGQSIPVSYPSNPIVNGYSNSNGWTIQVTIPGWSGGWGWGNYHHGWGWSWGW
ncbi:hypothetical protein Sulac_0919 [Sulfobacillus acidophilus DSM 10332]|uniref:Uncharacterized protein n=1 Tax=Sulfobacillus acidophilus (strain ATCC 700253 / DSM 10332 / NAL) TaxID=679936 RepID=G8TSP4_SULAD|nr:hypothetical protein Sulac_0919 [Sulfobacillus acidophilus DSM 10332]